MLKKRIQKQKLVKIRKKRTVIIRKKSVTPKPNLFGITELKSKYKNCKPGFVVRLRYVDNKPKIYKEFSNHKYGGKKQALEKAIKYRDEQVKILEKQGKWPADLHRTKPGVRNKTGVVGVQRAHQWGKGGKLDCYKYVASWRENGKIKTVSFGETKWGDEIALQMAIDCRMARKNIYED